MISGTEWELWMTKASAIGGGGPSGGVSRWVSKVVGYEAASM